MNGSGGHLTGGAEQEPEAAVLLVACLIGVLTGGGVVLFNNVIHGIQVESNPLNPAFRGINL